MPINILISIPFPVALLLAPDPSSTSGCRGEIVSWTIGPSRWGAAFSNAEPIFSWGKSHGFLWFVIDLLGFNGDLMVT